MQKFLDQGMTVKQIASPYMQSYSQLLETDVDAVDMHDPLIQQALQGTPDKQGQVAMKTVYEFEKSLRKDSRWLGTKNAKTEMTNAAMGMAKDWGLVG
jgi:hypothetical protein